MREERNKHHKMIVTDITVSDIVRDWMKTHGYNGLKSPDGKCECGLSQLFACLVSSRMPANTHILTRCVATYKRDYNPEAS